MPLTASEKAIRIADIDAIIAELNDLKFRINGGAPIPVTLKLQGVGAKMVELLIAVAADTFD